MATSRAAAGEIFDYSYEFKFFGDYTDAVYDLFPGSKTDSLKSAIQDAVRKIQMCLRYQKCGLMSIRAADAGQIFKVTVIPV